MLDQIPAFFRDDKQWLFVNHLSESLSFHLLLHFFIIREIAPIF